MTLWWLQPGWRDAICSCGARIWPEGDPDWGACYDCFSQPARELIPPSPVPKCDVCDDHEAVADMNGTAVCSHECSLAAKPPGDNPGGGT